MSGLEEETYSTMFTSLRHPARRKILRMLSKKPRNFSEILEELGISSSHLTYHLENLGELVSKMEDGKYKLSTFGEAAVATMSRVEEAPKTSPNLPSLSVKWKAFFAVLMIGLILLGSLYCVQYQTLSQLSTEYARIKERYEQLQVLLEPLGPKNAILTYEHTVNGSAETAFPRAIFNIYFIYCLTSDSKLEMALFFPAPVPPKVYLPVSVSLVRKEIWAPPGQSVIHIGGGWGINVTDSGTYSAPLPSAGWYLISVGGPWEVGPSGHVPTVSYTINYTMALKVKNLEGNYVPFFVGSPSP